MSTAHSEYMAKVQLQLQSLNARMDALQAGAREAAAGSRQECDSEMSKLRHQSNFALANLAEIAAAGEQGWDEMVAEVERLRGTCSPFVLLPRAAPLASRHALDTAVQALACAAPPAASWRGRFGVNHTFGNRAFGTKWG